MADQVRYRVTPAQLEADTRAAMTRHDWGAVARLATALDAYDAPRPANLLGAALWYAEQGQPVYPCRPLDKLPLPGSRGFKDATTDPDRIRAWWDNEPTANVAIPTGVLFDVWDFDGETGHTSWGAYGFRDNDDGWGGETVLGTCSTPRPGGLHVYVSPTGDGNKAGILPGVDYRGAGGYVLAPPSRTNRGTYRYLRPPTFPET